MPIAGLESLDNRFLDGLEDEWEDLVRAVRTTLRDYDARFQEVVLVHHGNRVATAASRARRRRGPNKKIQRTSDG